MRGSWQRLWTVAAFASIAAGTVGAEAQEIRDRDRTLTASRRIAEDLRKARIHNGPFYLLSSIQLADIGYDQQFFIPTADTTSGFSVGASAPQRLYFTPNRKTYLSIDVDPQWSYFRGGTKHDQFGYKSRGDVQFLLNHLYLDVYAIRGNQLRADTGELSSLLTRKSDEVGLTGELKYSSRTSLQYTALTRSQHYPLGDKYQPSDLPVTLLNLSEHSYRAALMHKTFPLTSLLLAAEYGGTSFSDAVYKNSHRRYAGAGLVYESGRTTGRFEAGYLRLDIIRPDHRDFGGAIGSLTFDHRLTGHWGASAGLARDLAYSIFANNDYYIANRASASTEYSLTRRFALNAGVTYVVDDYLVPTVGSKLGGLARRRDHISFPSVGWTYSSSRVTGGFDVGYLKRTSNFAINEVNGIRIIIRLSLTP